MENKAHALAAGIFVAFVAALLLALASWLTRDTRSYEIYEISTREPVNGLLPQAPVRYRGVEVGKVQDIGFDPRHPGNVLVRLAVQPRAPITRGTYATLGLQGVTGLAYIQLNDEGRGAPPLVAQNGAPPEIPLRPGLVSRLGERGEDVLAQVQAVADKVNQLLDTGNQQRVAATLDSLQQAAQSVTQLAQHTTAILDAQLGPRQVSIPDAVKNISAAADALRGTAVEARSTLKPLGQVASRLNAPGGAIDRLAEGATALSQAAGTFNSATLPRINLMADETTRAVREVQRAASGVRENPQALIFGHGRTQPGPGERGFVAPGAER